jgi:hypothetical protein
MYISLDQSLNEASLVINFLNELKSGSLAFQQVSNLNKLL